MSRQARGFSLIELLIVVAIILIIAAIAIPNLLRSRIAANESSAVNSLRTISTAQVAYKTTYPAIGYAPALADLSPPPVPGVLPTPTDADLIDAILAKGMKSGYGFQSTAALTCGAPDGLFSNLNPVNGVNINFNIFACPGNNRTGTRNFCLDDTGVIRQAKDPSTPCDFTPASPAIH